MVTDQELKSTFQSLNKQTTKKEPRPTLAVIGSRCFSFEQFGHFFKFCSSKGGSNISPNVPGSTQNRNKKNATWTVPLMPEGLSLEMEL